MTVHKHPAQIERESLLVPGDSRFVTEFETLIRMICHNLFLVIKLFFYAQAYL